MTLDGPSMHELLAPATHCIQERERAIRPLSFVRRVGSAAAMGGNPGLETPAQRKGRRYEARVGRWLRSCAAARCLTVLDHPWLEYQFEDETQTRRAQPDFVLLGDPNSYLFEVKQTWVDTSRQLELYTMLLAELNLDVIPATLCRSFTAATPRNRVVRKFEEIFPYSTMLVRA